MKKLIYLFVAFLTLSMDAQNFEIVKGPESKKEKGEYIFQFGADDTYLYTASIQYPNNQTKYQLFYTKVNKKTLQVVSTKELPPAYNYFFGGKGNLYLKGDKIYFFSVDDGREHSLILRIYNTKNDQEIFFDTLVKRIPTETDFKRKVEFYVEFYVEFSPDNSKLAVITQLCELKKIEFLYCDVDVYDLSNNKKITSKKIEVPNKTSALFSSSYAIENSGNVWFLLHLWNRSNKGIEANNFCYEPFLGKISSSGKIENPKMDQTKFYRGKLKIVDNKIICAGIFHDKTFTKPADMKGGSFFIIIDPSSGSISKSSFNYFAAAIDSKLAYKGPHNHMNSIYKEYFPVDIDSNGDSYYLIEEHNGFKPADQFELSDLTSLDYLNANPPKNSKIPSGLDIGEAIVFKYDKQAELLWTKVIPKKSTRLMGPFDYYLINDKFYFLYFENGRNLKNMPVDAFNMEEEVACTGVGGSIFVCTTLDKDGNIERKEVFTNDDWLHYRPYVSGKGFNLDGMAPVYMTNGDSYRFDRIKLK